MRGPKWRRMDHEQPLQRPVVSVPAGIGLTLAAAATLMLGIFPGHILRLANYASASLGMDSRQQCHRRTSNGRRSSHYPRRSQTIEAAKRNTWDFHRDVVVWPGFSRGNCEG